VSAANDGPGGVHKTQLIIPAKQIVSGSVQNMAPPKTEGAGNAGRYSAPAASRAKIKSTAS
jgi:hypothetical protein